MSYIQYSIWIFLNSVIKLQLEKILQLDGGLTKPMNAYSCNNADDLQLNNWTDFTSSKRDQCPQHMLCACVCVWYMHILHNVVSSSCTLAAALRGTISDCLIKGPRGRPNWGAQWYKQLYFVLAFRTGWVILLVSRALLVLEYSWNIVWYSAMWD